MRVTKARIFAALLAVLLLPAVPSHAQTWPQRPVKFIVPFGPGAGVDIGARLVADRLPARWGKAAFVENRPGADGLVAIQAFVSADDDHVLLFSPSSAFTVHPFQYEKLPYTPADLAPIGRLSNTILAIGVPASLHIGSLKELVERVRDEPGKFNAALVPGLTEFTFDYFVKSEGLSVTKVPYRNIVQAATDVGEGRVQIMMSSYAILQPQAQAGRIRILVVNGRQRAPILPEVPTAMEAGFPALQLDGLVGLFGPRGIASDVRDKIAADVIAAAADPVVAARLVGTAQVLNPGGPAEFAADIERQRAQNAVIARTIGLTPK
jgi:tripartite-type tricarboxylate transporter receptor subunit TctC